MAPPRSGRRRNNIWGAVGHHRTRSPCPVGPGSVRHGSIAIVPDAGADGIEQTTLRRCAERAERCDRRHRFPTAPQPPAWAPRRQCRPGSPSGDTARNAAPPSATAPPTQRAEGDPDGRHHGRRGARRRAPGPARQERARHGRRLGHRAGGRGALRACGAMSRSTTPASPRRRARPRSGCARARRRSGGWGCVTCWSAATSRTRARSPGWCRRRSGAWGDRRPGQQRGDPDLAAVGGALERAPAAPAARSPPSSSTAAASRNAAAPTEEIAIDLLHHAVYAIAYEVVAGG